MRFFYLFAGLVFLTFDVFAEEADTTKRRSIELDEIVIQSFKQTGNFHSLPLAASTINRISLQNQNILDIKDISAFIPNLFMPDYGSKLTSPVYIRGIGSKINDPSVGLYVDGIPYFQKSALDFDLNEIESIEVLRGPQGTLYGRNTMGGIINVYTKSPLQYQELYISASTGDYNNRNATLGYYGKTDNQFGYAISGNYNHTDGYFLNHYTGKNADGMDAGSGRIRLEWMPQPNLLLRLTQNVDYSNQGGYPYAPVDSTNKIGDVNYNEYSSYIRTLSSTGLSLTYTAKQFSLNSQTSYQYLSDKQGIDQDFSPQSLYFATQKQKQSTVSEEFNIKSSTSHWYQWLFGAFAFNQQINNNVGLNYEKQNYSTQKLYDMPTRGISVYHQSTFNHLLTDGLSLTLGIRYDYERASNDYKAYKDSADLHQPLGVNYPPLSISFSQLTPKVTLQYTLPSSQMIYVSATKGYKTGGFNTSFERDEDRIYEPEYSWNYEVGAKGRFWQNRIRTELCFFFIDWRNQQIYQTNPSGIGQMLKNAGHSQSKGIEASIAANLLQGLTIQANGGLTQAKFLDYVQSATVEYSGNYIPFVPEQTLGLAASYRIPVLLKQLDDLSINLQYTGTGKLYWAENNKFIQPYYGILNGKISATQGILTASLWARNIMNTEYTAYYFASMGKQYAQKGRPFMLGVSVSLLIK